MFIYYYLLFSTKNCFRLRVKGTKNNYGFKITALKIADVHTEILQMKNYITCAISELSPCPHISINTAEFHKNFKLASCFGSPFRET